MGCQLSSDVVRGGFALNGGIGGQNHLLDTTLGDPGIKLFESQVFRANTIQRRKMPVQDEIAPPITTRFLDGELIGRRLYHTQQSIVAPTTEAQLTQLLLGEGTAAPTITDLQQGLLEHRSQTLTTVPITLKQMHRHALCRFRTHARQYPERLHQSLNQGRKTHIRKAF